MYPFNGNEAFHVIVSDNTLTPGLGDYSISIQPDRAAEKQKKVPGYITTKLGQIESAYNRSSVSQFIRLLHFMDSGDDSWATSIGMTALAGLSSFTVKNCYGCVGLDEELLDGDKMMIAQLLTLKNGAPSISQDIAESLKHTYLTMRYERHVEHENGAYVKAVLEIGMLDRPPILRDTIYMELRNISYEMIAEQAIQATGIQNDTLRKALPRLFSGYYICDDFNSNRVRRGLGVSDDELARDNATSYSLYDFWDEMTVPAGSLHIPQKIFNRSKANAKDIWDEKELAAFEDFTKNYNIAILENKIHELEWENKFYASVPDIIAGGKEALDIGGMLLGFFVGNPLPAVIYLMDKLAENFGDARVLFDAEGAFLDAILDDMRANAIIKIQENEANIAAIYVLLREIDPNYGKNIPSALALGITEADYRDIFSSSGNTYDWNFAYWAALASFDTYIPLSKYSESYMAMEHMGFGDITPIAYNEDEIKAVYGLQELKVPINGKSYIVMIAFRGTYYGENSKDMRNIDTDLDYYPVTWYKQPPGNTYPPGQRLSENSTINAYCVHGGFYRYINQFVQHDLVKDGWFMYPSKPGKQILLSDCLFLITGHSLGGAMAELYTLRLSELGVRNEDVICYGVASPPCAPKETQQYAMERGISKRIHKLYHNKDITPHAGYYTYTLAQNPISFGDSSRTIFSKKFTEYHGKETYLPYILEHLG